MNTNHQQAHPTQSGTDNPHQELWHNIDSEMKAKRDNIISELINLRITKAKAKENFRRGGGIHLNLAVMQKELSD